MTERDEAPHAIRIRRVLLGIFSWMATDGRIEGVGIDPDAAVGAVRRLQERARDRGDEHYADLPD